MRHRRDLLRALVLLAALGATLGTLLDAIHTYGGATRYTNPVLARAAWWTPLLFGGAFAVGIVRPLLDRAPRPAAWRVAIAMGLFVLAYGLSVAPWAWPVRAAILGGLFVAGLLSCDRTRAGLFLALGAAIGGPTVEIALVHAGAFVHNEAIVLGIPGWLPPLYLTASIGIGTLARWLVLYRRDA